MDHGMIQLLDTLTPLAKDKLARELPVHIAAARVLGKSYNESLLHEVQQSLNGQQPTLTRNHNKPDWTKASGCRNGKCHIRRI